MIRGIAFKSLAPIDFKNGRWKKSGKHTYELSTPDVEKDKVFASIGEFEIGRAHV